jgi:RNA polymerase sigma-70 factor (ECF subfamily)
MQVGQIIQGIFVPQPEVPGISEYYLKQHQFMKSSEHTREQVFKSELLPHYDAIYSFAYRLTNGDAVKAGDLVQETYEKAWRSIGRYESGTNPRAWMFRICQHAFINEWRKVRNMPVKLDLDAAGRIQSDNEPNHAQMGDEVMNAINTLPNQQRIVLLLDLQDFTYEEMATVLKIRIGTVRSRLHRARKALYVCLSLYARDLGYRVPDDADAAFPTDDQ